MSLLWNSRGFNGHFDVLCDGAEHILQYWTLSRKSIDSMLTNAGLELVNDAISTSFIAEVAIPSPLDDRRDDVLPNDPILLIVSQRRLV